MYGIEKRPKVHAVNKWDCHPTSRREIQPDRRSNLRKKLLSIDLAKKEVVTLAVASATNDVQRKKAIEAQTMLMRYGTSCFLQLLDDAPAPSSQNRILMAGDERIARAEALRSKFQKNLSCLLDQVNREHTYSTYPITAAYYEVENVPPPLHLVRSLYEEHVCISASEAINIEACTRSQTSSDLWHNKRKLRISAENVACISIWQFPG